MDSCVFASQVQRLLYKLVRNYEVCNRACLSQHGVTASQGYTLLALPQEASMNMNELSDAMGLASSTMTRMVDQLVGKKLVHREPDEADRRVVLVNLTARGRDVQSTLAAQLQEFFAQALENIPEDEHPAIVRALELVNQSIAEAVAACCAD